MKRNLPACLALTVFAIVFTAAAESKSAEMKPSAEDELAADLQLLQGTWELAPTGSGSGPGSFRSVKTIAGNRETVRRYRIPSGDLADEQTVEFVLSKSGGVRVFTFFPLGGTAEHGRSYVYRVDHDDFYDVPGLLAEGPFDNYQVLPKVWHWKRVAGDVAQAVETSPPRAAPAGSTTGVLIEGSPAAAGNPQRIKEPRKARVIPQWGTVVDPENDCKIVAGGLQMLVPPTNHDLNPLRGLSAPRVVRPVTGDFEVSVKVTADFQPGTTAVGKGAPFNGAGILIWQDAENFLRIERNAWRNGETLWCYPPLIEYWNDRRYSGANKAAVPADEFFQGDSTWLKATRRGKRITVSMSRDGKKWNDVRAFDVELDQALQVGVAALNTSDKPFLVEFDEFHLGLE